MISEETLGHLEKEHIPYILGARMRRVKEIKEEAHQDVDHYKGRWFLVAVHRIRVRE